MSTVVRTDWPPLALADWQETQRALHLRTQIVGKTRLALAPMQNHWWQTALYVTSRGLGTSPIPDCARTFEVDFDFLADVLIVRTSNGAARRLPLRAQTIASFYADYMEILRSLGIELHVWPVPVEIPNPVRFEDDHRALPYDRDAVEQCFRVLVQVDRVLKDFRGEFLGKCSPSHLWWGAFDIACTRFSGRRAPVHAGGVPNLADFVTREAYSHECISAGWWPGTPGGPVEEAALYAYAYPEPKGYREADVGLTAARYNEALGEWVLPYASVVSAADPDALIYDFLEGTYDAAARLGHWPRDLVRRQ